MWSTVINALVPVSLGQHQLMQHQLIIRNKGTEKTTSILNIIKTFIKNLREKFTHKGFFNLLYLLLCIQFCISMTIALVALIKLSLCYIYVKLFLLIFSPFIIIMYYTLYLTLAGNLFTFYHKSNVPENLIYLTPMANYGM